MAFSPLGPSIITSRTSCSVGPMRATRLTPRRSTRSRTHSAPARVFPAPRPPIISHTRQSPSGGSWLGRAHARHTFLAPSGYLHPARERAHRIRCFTRPIAILSSIRFGLISFFVFFFPLRLELPELGFKLVDDGSPFL